MNFYEDGYALLIGIRYGGWPKPLEGPLKDVEALKNNFQDLNKAAYKAENILTITETNATTLGILNALDELAIKTASNPEASVIIYYSGHGGNHDNKYFLVPYDFNLKEYQDKGTVDETKAILTKAFAEKISAVKSKKCLVILDCCHAENIPVEKSLKRSPQFIEGFLDELDATLEETATQKSIGNKIKKGSGRVILTSCQAEETSLDLGHLSLFTKVLLESLNGTSNIEKDGWVRLIDLMRYVPKTVANEALKNYSHQQNPMFKKIENLTAEDFIICAYDISKAKGFIQSTDGPPESFTNSKEIIDIIDEGNYSEVFKRLDSLNLNKLQYNRLKKEYSAGIKGIDLIDFADRLKVFITNS